MLGPLALLATAPVTLAYCPLYGNVFPKPTNPASSATIQDALAKFNSAMETAFRMGNTSNGAVDPNSAHAYQIFTLYDDAPNKPLYEYYHDGTLLSNSTGVKHVDGDSVFRIGSVSKLNTVYMLLYEIGDKYWDTPVTEVVPEMKGRDKWNENEINHVRWEDVTLGALAGQIAGVTRDLAYFQAAPLETLLELGLPPLSPKELPKCVIDMEDGNNCTRQEFFEALDDRKPTFKPNTQPVYSNTAFAILGYALESITGKAYGDILTELADAVGWTRTTQDAPEESQGVIPYNVTASGWHLDLGSAAAMGGIYSSVNDLSQMGRSILNSTVLDPNITRAWLKPTSETSDLRGSVGRPWEIIRADIIPSRGVVDMYTKGGSVGMWNTFFIIVPDYNIGMSAAVAGGGLYLFATNFFLDIVIPAFEVAAREQANEDYAGTYTATNGLNSTITLSTDTNTAGLGIDQWISNGTNLMETLPLLLGGSIEQLRLLPTNLERKTANGKTEIVWRGSIDPTPRIDITRPFAACPSWQILDGTSWGEYGLDEFLFTLDQDGKAGKVNPRAFRLELEKTSLNSTSV